MRSCAMKTQGHFETMRKLTSLAVISLTRVTPASRLRTSQTKKKRGRRLHLVTVFRLPPSNYGR